jgi:hypothetical protein
VANHHGDRCAKNLVATQLWDSTECNCTKKVEDERAKKIIGQILRQTAKRERQAGREEGGERVLQEIKLADRDSRATDLMGVIQDIFSSAIAAVESIKSSKT